MNSYDRFPYPSYPYPQTHPDHLAMVATLLSLDPPRHAYRVLELGCATGGNLIPMAVHRPDCQFWGIDYSSRQIEVGQRLVSDLGLTNIRLDARSILDITEADGQFDYILCHGVYSWVPGEIQAKILTICQQQLTPHGVAFISFNTHPGWRQRSALRDMMRYHVDRAELEDPVEQVQQARNLLDFLVQANAGSDSSYSLMLREQHESLQHHTDSYIFHEHLEEHNQPDWFLDFCQRLTHHQLRFLADSDFSTMVSASRLNPELQQALDRIAPDLLSKEQYMDFVRNRSFRQTLVCHADCKPDYGVRGERLQSLYAASSGHVVWNDQDSDPWQFVSGGLSFRTPIRATQIALEILASSWPNRVAMADLLSAVESKLRAAADEVPEGTRDLVLKALLTAYVTGAGQIVELSSHGFQAGPTSSMPRVGPLTHHQIEQNLVVVNPRHMVVPTKPIDRRVLPLLDGTSDRECILEALMRQHSTGDLTIHDAQDQAITNPALARELMVHVLEERLVYYHRSALFN